MVHWKKYGVIQVELQEKTENEMWFCKEKGLVRTLQTPTEKMGRVGLQPLPVPFKNCKGARPMAPSRSSTRHATHLSPVSPTPPAGDAHDDDPAANKELFLDPMLGTPLAIYIEKDVENKDDISQLIIVSRNKSSTLAGTIGKEPELLCTAFLKAGNSFSCKPAFYVTHFP
jgi:hypothetical protein